MRANRSRFTLKPVLLALLLAFPAQQAIAVSCTWNPASGNWGTAGNWSCGAVPRGPTSDSALIGAGKTVTINDQESAGVFRSIFTLNNAGTMQLDAFGLSLQAAGSTTNTGTINVGGAGTAALQVNFGHNINNAGGVINIANGSVLNQYGSTLSSGTINTTGTGSVVVFNSNSNFLSGVTLNGTLDMETQGFAREQIINGATLNGAVNIGSSGILGLNSASTIGGNQTISGTGTINLNVAGAHLSIDGTGTTTLSSGITVRGQGNIGAGSFVSGNNTLVNNGRISADVSGGTLTLSPPASGSGSSIVNNNLLDALSGGTLVINTNVSNTAGQINAQNGSNVVLGGVTITGGMLGTSGTGVVQSTSNQSNFLNGVTVAGVLDMTGIANSRQRLINTATIDGSVNVGNGGIVSLDSSASTGNSVVVGGTGVINLNDATARLSVEGGGTSTLAAGLTVRGQGNIGTALLTAGNNVLTNNGLLSADVSGGTLTIAAPASGSGSNIINNGTLQAINGGTLLLSTNINSNSGSQIVAGAGSAVVQNGVKLNGVINVSGTGSFQATSNAANFLDGTTLTGALDLTSISNSRERIINGATLNGSVNIGNGGALSLDSGAGAASQTLAGTAVINLNDAAARLTIEGGGSTTLGSGITVRGQGNFGAAIITGGNNVLTNNGLVSADVGGGTLTIAAPASGSGSNIINNGTLQAINGGTLLLSTNILANPGGQIVAGAGSAVVQNGVTVNGVINATGSGVFTASSNLANILDGVSFTGTLDLGSIANARERIINGATINGSVNISQGGVLSLDSSATSGGNQTITGNATFNLNDPGAHLTIDGAGTTTLDSGVVVRGQGNMGLALYTGGNNTLVNNGRISADVSGGTLTLSPPASGSGSSIVNNNLLDARSGGTLVINTNVSNTAGQINAQNGSNVVLSGVTVTGGTLGTSGTGVIQSTSNLANFLDGVTMAGVLDMTGIANSRQRLINTATINGSVNVGNGGIVSLDSSASTGNSVVVGGTGVINLNDAAARLSVEGGGTTTLGASLTVRGQGNIGTALFAGGNNTLVNNGRISADVSGGTLTLSPPASGSGSSIVNNNLLDALSGGTLVINTNVSNTAGQINAQNGSNVVLGGVTITGGTLGTSGTGVVQSTSNQSNFLNGVTVAGVLDMTGIANSRQRLINTATINGSVNVGNGGIVSLDSSASTGNSVVVGGTGVINLNDAAARLSVEGGGTSTLAAGLTVRGQGNIGTALLIGGNNVLSNNGLILADGGTLTISAPANGSGSRLAGTGTLQTSGGTLNLATGAASTQGKLVMGGAGSTLNLNTQNLTITNDYTNAQSGTGNSFSRRAGVTGTGQILASGDVKQAITGANVTGGSTANATLTIGNVHVGNNSVLYQIANAGTNGPALRGAIQTIGGGANISDTRLSGAGVTASNYGPVAAGSSTGSLAVNFNAASAGTLAPLTGQAVNIVNNFDNVNSQLLSIQVGATAAAYNLAQGSATPTPVTIANQRIGGTTSQILTVTNTAPSSFTEGLNASFGANTGDASNNGLTLTRIPGNSSNGNTMSVGVNTGSAGAKTGTVTLNYVSDGLNTSGLGLTSVGSQSINVSGNVYQMAIGNASSPIQIANQRVLGANTATVTVTNSASGPSGFVEDLNVSVDGSSGAATGSGTITGRLAGTNNTGTGAVLASVDTGSAGAKTGTVTLNYQTAGTVNGVSKGLNTAGAGNQAITVNGNVYQTAQPDPSALPATVGLGNFRAGSGSQSQTINLANTIIAPAAFQEGLAAIVQGTSGTATGTGFTNAAAGASGALQVGLNGIAAGLNSGAVQVQLQTNGITTSGSNGLGSLNLGGVQTVNVTGTGWRLASANTLGAVSFGNVHVGDTVQQALSITNTAINDGFSEKLTASFGTSSDARITNSGSISQLAAGASNNSSMIVGLNTAAAGTVNGTQTIDFKSDGTGTSGLGLTNLASQIIGVSGDITTSGSVYRLASAGPATPNPVNFGNVRIGSSADQALSISNTAVNDGFSEKLSASISSNGTPVTASGSFNLLAAQSTDNSSLHVGIDTSSAGAKGGSATIALVSDGTGTSGLGTTTLAPQTVNVTGAVYRMASPTLGTSSVTIAARLGDSVSANQAVSITNSSPDIYTEGLKVTASASGNAQSNGGSIANLAAQGTDNSAIKVGLGSTASAGTTSGQVNLSMVSTGAGTTGASDASLGSQVVTVVGKVYQQAVAAVNTAAVNFGIVHVGDPVAAQNVTVTNNAAATALNDVLKGSIDSVSGPVTAIASANLGAGLGAGATGNIAVGLNTSSAGLINGNVMLALVSSNADMTDLSLSGQTLTVSGQVNNYAKADILKASGAGSLNRSGSTITLNLGTFMQGSGSVQTELEVMNNVTGLSDLLKGSFDLTGADDFSFTGFGTFAGLAAGAAYTGLDIAFDTAALGLFSDQITLNGVGYNGSGYTDSQILTLVLTANVVAGGTVPEPGTLMLLAIALAGMLIQRRRAMLN